MVRFLEKGRVINSDYLRANNVPDVFINEFDAQLGLYDYEHQYLRPEIKRLKNRISMINHSISLMRVDLQRLQAYLLGVTFGTKKLFKAQFTKYAGQRHGLWLTKWRCARVKSFKIVGRKDGKYGNFVFKYQPVESRL